MIWQVLHYRGILLAQVVRLLGAEFLVLGHLDSPEVLLLKCDLLLIRKVIEVFECYSGERWT